MVGILSSGLHTTVVLFFPSPQTPASGVSFAKETMHRHEADVYTVTKAQCVTRFPKFLTHTDSLILGLLIWYVNKPHFTDEESEASNSAGMQCFSARPHN